MRNLSRNEIPEVRPLHLTPESSTRIFEIPKCEIDRHLAEYATHCYGADVSADGDKLGRTPCTVTPHDQSTRMCFKSSRLLLSSSRTRFCSARASAEYCPCFSEARRARPFQFRDASRSSTTLGNLLTTPAPNSLANRDIYRGISRSRPASPAFLVAESER